MGNHALPWPYLEPLMSEFLQLWRLFRTRLPKRQALPENAPVKERLPHQQILTSIPLPQEDIFYPATPLSYPSSLLT